MHVIYRHLSRSAPHIPHFDVLQRENDHPGFILQVRRTRCTPRGSLSNPIKLALNAHVVHRYSAALLC